MLTIGLIATFDTKGEESGFTKAKLEQLGCRVLTIDTGLLFEPGIIPDVPRSEVLKAGGIEDAAAAEKEFGKNYLVEAVTRGLCTVVKQLYDQKKIDGIISLGGAQGSAISTSAMKQLPIGFPKVMVSTIACGSTQFGDYVGNKDIVMIPSICDICGINPVIAPILASGAAAVVGMAKEYVANRDKKEQEKPTVAITMAGITTAGVMQMKKLLESRGYSTIIFHCNGVGAELLDELARDGKLCGVLDVTPHDFAGYLNGGLLRSKPNRFENVYRMGVPVIMLPGGSEMLVRGPLPLPKELEGQPYLVHTKFHTHVACTPEMAYNTGKKYAEKLAESTGEAAFVVPMRGFGQHNKEGGKLYCPATNEAFAKGVRENAGDKVEYIEKDLHINDPEMARFLVDLIIEKSKRYLAR